MIQNIINQEAFYNIPNGYYVKEFDPNLDPNFYKSFIGGSFEIAGEMHLSILKKYGLSPDMKFIDIGCGALRSGVKIINFLDPFNYFGIDVNTSILHAAYNNELKKYNLQDKVTESNFCITDNFQLEQFKTKFDMGMAQSVFTHLPINHIQYCLLKIAPFFKSKGKFLTTFLFCDEDKDVTQRRVYKSDFGNTTASLIYDVYHIKRTQLKNFMQWHELSDLWDFEFLSDEHPKLQNWVLFSRK